MNVQWLFVGGPAHGKAVWVNAVGSVRWEDDGGKVYEYQERTFVLADQRYRLGLQSGGSIDESEVTKLIRSTNLEPLDRV